MTRRPLSFRLRSRGKPSTWEQLWRRFKRVRRREAAIRSHPIIAVYSVPRKTACRSKTIEIHARTGRKSLIR
jgi:hypothetical protein